MVRHGQSQHNVGPVDDDLLSELTERGRCEAIITGKYLSKYTFDLVITSGLIRTHQTADLIIKQLKHVPDNIRHLNIFNELGPRNLSKQVEESAGEILKNFLLKYRDDPIGYQANLRKTIQHMDKLFKVKETIEHDERLVKEMVRYLTGLANQQVLLVAHNGTIQDLITAFLNLPFGVTPKGRDINPCGNCNLTIMEYSSYSWKMLLPTTTTHLYAGAHKMSVKNPWLDFILNGKKTVEGRLLDDKRKTYKKKDYIQFNDQKVFQIKELVRYKSFEDMLIHEGLSNVLPEVKTIKEGVATYHQFYPEESERKLGVVAIRLTRCYTKT